MLIGSAFGLIAGEGLGVSNSSLFQIGPILPQEGFGQAKIKAFVNVSNGNLVVQDHPVTVIESGFPLQLGYVYNSQATSIDKTWQLAVSKSLALQEDNTVQLTEVDGHVTTYAVPKDPKRPNDPPRWIAPGLASGTPYLTQNSDKTWVRYHPGTQITENYDENGKLTSRTDNKKQVTTFTYGKDETDPLIVAITGPSGTTYTVTKNGSTVTINLVQNGQPNILQTHQFDNLGRLSQTITPPDETSPSGYSIHYVYDQSGTSDKLIGIQQDDGTVLGFDTEGTDHVRRIAAGTNFTEIDYGSTVLCTDAVGNTTAIDHTQNQITSVSRQQGYEFFFMPENVEGVKELKSPHGGETKEGVKLHKNHFLVKKDKNDGLAYCVMTPEKVVVSASITREELQKQLGNRYEALLEALNSKDILKLKKFRRDILKLTADRNHTSSVVVTSYSYQPAGQVSLIAHPDKSIETFQNDPSSGLLISHIAVNGEITNFNYDVDRITYKSNLVSVVKYQSGPSLRSTPQQTEVKQAVQQQIDIKDAAKEIKANSASLTTTYIYDPQNNFRRFEISPMGCVTEYRPIDAKNNNIASKRVYFVGAPVKPDLASLIAWVDQNKQQCSLTEYVYDSRGQIERIRTYAHIDQNGIGMVDAEMGEEIVQWDEFGGCLTHRVKMDGNTDSITTQTFENQLHRKASITNSVGPHTGKAEIKDTVLSKTTISYFDAVDSEQITTTLPNNRVEGNKYDMQGLVKISNATWNPTSIQQNIQQNNQQIINPSLEVKRAQAHPKIQSPADQITRTTNFEGDQADRTVLIIHPESKKDYKLYDRQNRLAFSITTSGIVTEYIYDDVNSYTGTRRYSTPVAVAEILDSGLPSIAKLRQQLTSDTKNDREAFVFTNVVHKRKYTVDGGPLTGHFVTEQVFDAYDHEIARITYDAELTADELNNLKQHQTLTRILNPQKDRCTRYFYNDDGKCIAEQNAGGYVTEYVRDVAGRIIRKVVYDTKTTIDLTKTDFNDVRPPESKDKDATTYYYYNAKNQCISEVDPEGYCTEHTYTAKGQPKTHRTYATKLVESATKPEEKITWADRNQPPQPVEDPEDQTTRYTYDAKDRLIRVDGPSGKSVITDYDAMDHAIGVTTFDFYTTSVDEKGQIKFNNIGPSYLRSTKKRYDGFEQVVKEANPFICDLLAKIDADPTKTPEQKAAAKQQVWDNQSTRDEFDPKSGLKLKSTDSLGGVTYFYYDLDRRPIYVVGPTGIVVKTTFTSFKEEVSEIRTLYTKLTDEQRKALSGGYITKEDAAKLFLEDDVHDARFQFVRNQRGLLVKRIDPEGAVTEYAYNAFKQCTKETNPLSGSQKITVTRDYDTRGNEITTTTKSGDPANPQSTDITTVIKREFENPYGKQTALIENPANGKKESKQTEAKETKDENTESRYETQYDKRGFVQRTLDPIQKAVAPTKGHRYTRDAFGRVLNETDALDNITTHAYNQKARTHTITTSEGVKQVTKSNVFGQKLAMTNGLNQTESWDYEPDGQVALYIDANGNKTSDEHNLLGQRTSHTDPKGTKTVFERDDNGDVICETEDVNGLKLATTYLRPDGVGGKVIVTDPRKTKRLNIADRCGRVTQSIVDPSDELLALKPKEVREKIPAPKVESKKSSVHLLLASAEELKQEIKVKVQPAKFDRKPIPTQEMKSPATYRKSADSKNDQQDKSKEIKAAPKLQLITHTRYNEQGSAVEVVRGDMTNSDQSRMGLTQDGLDRSVGQIKDPNGLHLATTMQLDFRGKTISTTDPNGNVTWFFYDSRGKKNFEIDPEGGVKQWVYDLEGNPTSYRIYEVAIPQEILNTFTAQTTLDQVKQDSATLIDINDTITYYFYDKDNRERFAVTSLGAITEKVYDAASREIQHIRYATRIDKDKVATQTTDTLKTFTQQNKSPKDRQTIFIKDAKGQDRFTIDPEGYLVERCFDAKGNEIVNIVYATQLKPDQIAPIAALTEDRVRAELKRQKLFSSENDRVSYKIYDSMNRLRGIVNGEAAITRFDYDESGNEVQVCKFADRAASIKLDSDKPLYTDYDQLVSEVVNRTPDPTTDCDFLLIPQASKIEVYELKKRTYVLTSKGLFYLPQDCDLIIAESSEEKELRLRKPTYILKPEGIFYFPDPIKPQLFTKVVALKVKDEAGLLQQLSTCPAEKVHPLSPETQKAIKAKTGHLPIPDRVSKGTYDAANRQIVASIFLNGQEHAEFYKRDALNNITAHTDRMGQVWSHELDRAERVVTKTDPASYLTEGIPNPDGSNNFVLPNAVYTPVQATISYDKAGNEQIVTLGIAPTAPGNKPRELRLGYNKCNKVKTKTIPNVPVDDPSIKQASASIRNRPEKVVDLVQTTNFNGKQKPVVEIDNAGNYIFRVFNQEGNQIFEVQQLDSDNEHKGQMKCRVIEFKRGTFGEIEQVIKYDTPFYFQPTKDQIAKGLKTSDIVVPTTPKDRVKKLTYDNRGDVTLIDEGQVFNYSPNADGTYQASLQSKQTRVRFNANREEVYRARRLIDPKTGQEIWAKDITWRDRTGAMIATSNPLQAIKRYQLNAFGQEEQRTEYGTVLPDNAELLMPSCAGLDVILASIADPKKDRKFAKEYNQAGKVTKSIRVGVVRQEIDVDPQTGKASIKNLDPKDLTTEFTYNAQQQMIAIKDEMGGIQCFYFNERGIKCAEAGVPRVADPRNGNTEVRPLFYCYSNAAGQYIGQSDYITGAEQLTADPTVWPQPKAQGVPGDRVKLVIHDGRGNVIWEVDGEGHIKGFTFDPNNNGAREYYQLTNLQELVVNQVKEERQEKKKEPQQESKEVKTQDPLTLATATQNAKIHTDETQKTYSATKKVTKEEKVRDGVVAKTTQNFFNTFDDQIGQGDGSATIFIWKVGPDGQVYATNEAEGVWKVTLRNLKGEVTSAIISGGDNDLSKCTYADLAALVTLSQTDISLLRSDKVLDLEGRTVASVLPAIPVATSTLPPDAKFVKVPVQIPDQKNSPQDDEIPDLIETEDQDDGFILIEAASQIPSDEEFKAAVKEAKSNPPKPLATPQKTKAADQKDPTPKEVKKSRPDTTVIRPVLKTSFSPSGGVESTTDAMNNTTTFELSDLDQPLKRTSPPVATVLRDNNSKVMPLVENHGYNLKGELIATTNANGDTTTFDRNAAGQVLKETDGEGVSTLSSYDGFSRNNAVADGRGNWSQTVHDRADHITAYIPPSRNRRQDFVVNELGDRSADVFSDQTCQIYNSDVNRNITASIQPLGQITTFKHNWHNFKVSETNPDNTGRTWDYTLQGQLKGHTDLSAVPYTLVRDNAGRLCVQTTTGASGKHGEMLKPNDLEPSNVKPFPTPDQNISYTYVGDALIEVKDVANDMNSVYAYNPKKQRMQSKVTNLSGKTVYQDAMSEWDALDREFKCTETMDPVSSIKVVREEKYDGLSNIRATDITFRDRPISSIWNTLDPGSRPKILNGLFNSQTKQVEIAFNQGTSTTYLQGYPYKVTTIAEDGHLVEKEHKFDADGYLTDILTPSRSGGGPGVENRIYDVRGRPQHAVYTAPRPPLPPLTVPLYDAQRNANGWELTTQNGPSTTQTENYTAMGLFMNQTVTHQLTDDPSDPKKAYTITDTLTATYNALEQYQLRQLEGTSVDSRTGQSTSALTTNLVNPNGGSAGLYRGVESWKMLFTNYDGSILRQTVLFDSTWPPRSEYVSVRNLVTPGGNFWGSCDEPDPRRPFMSTPMVIPSAYSIGRGGGMRIVPNTQGLNDTSLLSGDDNLYSRQKLPFEPSFPPPMPDTCQVAMGDTPELISNRFGLGDEKAPMIRAVNGIPQGESNLRPDQTLRLINSFFNTVHINDRTHPSYQVFIQQMRGSLYPHFKIEPPKPHQHHASFLKVLAEVIAGALVIALAPCLAHFVLMPLIYGGTIGVALGAGVAATGAELLVTAVTGTLLNLGYQGIVSKDISVLQAVTSGFSLYIGGAAQAAALVGKTESVLAELGMKFLSATSIAVMSQLATMAQTGHFEIGEVFANIFMQFATAGLPLPKNIPGQFAEGVIDGAGASLLNSVATGQRIRALDVAASALGTGIVKGGMVGIEDIREAEIQRTHDMAKARAQAMQQAMAEANAAERMQPMQRQASAPVSRQTGHRQPTLQDLEMQRELEGLGDEAAQEAKSTRFDRYMQQVNGVANTRESQVAGDKWLQRAARSFVNETVESARSFAASDIPLNKESILDVMEIYNNPTGAVRNGVNRVIQGAQQEYQALRNGDPVAWGKAGADVAMLAAPTIGAAKLIGRFGGLLRATEVPESFEALSSKAAFGGQLYPSDKMQQLVKYLERRNISVYATEGNPAFIAKADGTGHMLLPTNPTILQVKHELSHYLDFKTMGFEAYKNMGRLGRETSVLERLQQNRVWDQLNVSEQEFSINYVERLINDPSKRFTP